MLGDNKPFKKAALMRNAILEALTTNPGLTARELAGIPCVALVTTNPLDLDGPLRDMARQGKLIRAKDSVTRKFYYKLAVGVKPDPKVPSGVKVTTTSPSTETPAVQITVIKSTGKLRVCFKGISIELGVE